MSKSGNVKQIKKSIEKNIKKNSLSKSESFEEKNILADNKNYILSVLPFKEISLPPELSSPPCF